MAKQSKKILIAPSILSADFGRLADEIRDIERGGCDLVHVDVMDGHFVPNITIGAPVVRSIRKATKLPLDVHLMIEEPEKYLDDFRKAGSDWITVHVEALPNVGEILREVRKSGAKTGLSLRPKTPISEINPYLEILDLVLVMTVEPGFGGQVFMPEMIQKIMELRPKFSGMIAVDGGITKETAPIVLQAGVDILVAGTAIFGQKDRAQAIRDLRFAKKLK